MIPLTVLSPVGASRHPENGKTIERLSQVFDLSLSECFGVSEVARARNRVASAAAEGIAEKGGLVLWLDADMVADARTVLAHAQLVHHMGRAISGRYVTRQDETRIAASRIDPGFEWLQQYEGPSELHTELEGVAVKLTLCMTGMGCLMMRAEEFLDQFERSPPSKTKRGGRELRERLVCCPSIVEDPNEPGNFQMLSEDFGYCLDLRGGTWLAEIQSDPPKFLDYGHIAERVLVHRLGVPSQFRDDR